MNKKEKEVEIYILKDYNSDESENEIKMIYILRKKRKKLNSIKQQLNNKTKNSEQSIIIILIKKENSFLKETIITEYEKPIVSQFNLKINKKNNVENIF